MIHSRRTKPRPGRLQGADMAKLRNDVFDRDEGLCHRELADGTICGRLTLFNAPPEWDSSFHLAHRKGKRMWGDYLETTQCECGEHHRMFHNYGPSMKKPCPKK